MNIESQSEPPVLFIGGTGRCGSSILREALGRHSKCGALNFEHRFLIDPDGIIDFYSSYEKVWSPYNYDLRLKRLSRFLKTLSGERGQSQVVSDWHLPEYQYKGWNLEEYISGFRALSGDLINNLIDFQFEGKWVGGRKFDDETSIFHSHCRSKDDVKQSMQAFSWAAIDSLLSGLNRSIYVEDNTWNQLYAPQLLDIFPSSKFVHIYRHPCDVIASFLTQSWCPNTVEQAADFYKSLMDQWLDTKNILPADKLLEISYENFVADPTATYNQICRFLEIDFEDEMLATEIVSSAKGQWKTKIPADEQDALYSSLKKYITILGYSTESL